jgi:hypothetical protein
MFMFEFLYKIIVDGEVLVNPSPFSIEGSSNPFMKKRENGQLTLLQCQIYCALKC